MAKKNNGHSAQPEASAVESTQQPAEAPRAPRETEQQSDGAEEAPPHASGSVDYSTWGDKALVSEIERARGEGDQFRAALAPIDEHVEKLEGMLAERLIRRAKEEKRPIPTVPIAGQRYQPKAGRKGANGFVLVKYTERRDAALDD